MAIEKISNFFIGFNFLIHVHTVSMNNNRLALETSPYLKQHSNNPVNWYPWGEEAFLVAANENKPVFLSIGYSACHWCHVMAKESFEDNETAEILNRAFVSIKVDREERPDIDGIYMEACRILTGSGGWPLSVFLTPQKKPFYAGTYFPKYSKYGKPAFMDLLLIIEKKWKTDSEAIINNSDIITNNLEEEETTKTPASQNIIESHFNYLKMAFDPKYGGFGSSPKFPMPSNLLFLSRYGTINNNALALKMLYTTLDAMYAGGIYDHIGGGFARYSTDNYWLVPHFEKMLYDNAQLINVYTLGYNNGGDEKYRKIASIITNWLTSEMQGAEGGLYSALDADSGGIEGLYYLFTLDEIEKVLGKERSKIFSKIYDISQKGNFEGKNIPNLIKSKNTDSGSFAQEIEKLYNYRKNRMSLNTDDKYLSFWNSLAVRAFAEAYRRTLSKKYLFLAESIFLFIQKRMTDELTVFTAFKDEKHSSCGVLDDVASYISASISLYLITADKKYLTEAEKRTKITINDFWDFDNDGFFFTSARGENLIIRRKEIHDGVTPSGNSIMYENLLLLSKISDDSDKYLNFFEKLEKYLDGRQSYGSRGYYAYAKLLKEGSSIVCVLPSNASKIAYIKENANKLFCYDIVIFKDASLSYKLLNEKPTFYICANGTCLPPSNDLT